MEGCLEQGLSYEVGALVAVFINKGRQWMRGVEEWDTSKKGEGQSMRDGVELELGMGGNQRLLSFNYVFIGDLGIGTIGQ